ncbi:MAG: VCBS repeat-containing protein, partial [Myxococcales bacterium]|nr:VCBS repeat-containing protein [Myxococcales bacterium]
MMGATSEPTGNGPTSPTEDTSAGSMTNGMTSTPSEATTGPTTNGPTDPTEGMTSNPTQTSQTSLTSDTEPDPDTSNSDTDTTAASTPNTSDTSDGTTAGVSDSNGTSSGSTGGEQCAPDKVCNDDCCADDQVCVEEQCQKDCGGPMPCGPMEECCADNELCYLGECVVPGAACMQTQCATQIANDCGPGYVCDDALDLCLPSKADPSCIYKPPAQTFKPVPTFTWGARKSVNCANVSQCQTAETCTNGKCTPTWPHLNIAMNDLPTYNQSSSTAAVVDLDKDCIPEIIFNTYPSGNPDTNGVLRVIRGDNGAKVWTFNDAAYRTNGTDSPAVGDVDNDGEVDIFATAATANILRFDSAGKLIWKSEAFTGAKTSPAIAIANMDGEGHAEILYGSTVFSSTGKKVWEGAAGKGVNSQGPISCVADLNADGKPELLAGRTAYTFTGKVADNNFVGSTLWNTAAGGDGFCGIADFDDDGKPEVIRVASGTVYAHVGATGALITSTAIPNAGNGGPPNIADFDGDGVPDVAAAGNSRYTVWRFDAKTFSQIWTAPVDDTSSQVTGSSVFDFDGDGKNEVVYNDEVYIRIYPGQEPDCLSNPPGPACDKNMTDAEVLFRDRNGSRTRTEYPVIVDVDGDFKAEIVFPTNNDGGSGVLDAGLEVWGDSLDNWVTTRPVWNQHTYHIT